MLQAGSCWKIVFKVFWSACYINAYWDWRLEKQTTDPQRYSLLWKTLDADVKNLWFFELKRENNSLFVLKKAEVVFSVVRPGFFFPHRVPNTNNTTHSQRTNISICQIFRFVPTWDPAAVSQLNMCALGKAGERSVAVCVINNCFLLPASSALFAVWALGNKSHLYIHEGRNEADQIVSIPLLPVCHLQHAPTHHAHSHTLCKIPVFSALFVLLLVCVWVCLFAGNRNAISAGCTMGKWSRSEGRNIKTNQHPEQPPPQPPPSNPPPSCARAGRPLVLARRHVEYKMAVICLTARPNVPRCPIFWLI